MKKIIQLALLSLFFFGFTAVGNAQDELSDKALSAKYKQELKILDAEMKTIKAKIKADSANAALKAELIHKKEAYDELKKKKSTIDKAISQKKTADKAAKKADKAADKAAQASRDAQRVRDRE